MATTIWTLLSVFVIAPLGAFVIGNWICLVIREFRDDGVHTHDRRGHRR
jgi:hypothetical protein